MIVLGEEQIPVRAKSSHRRHEKLPPKKSWQSRQEFDTQGDRKSVTNRASALLYPVFAPLPCSNPPFTFKCHLLAIDDDSFKTRSVFDLSEGTVTLLME